VEYANACLICNSRKIALLKAIVHPFIAERIWNKAPFGTELFYCSRCVFAFYRLRPSEAELSLLYRNYRMPEYQRARQRHEKEYTPEYNQMLGNCKLNHSRKTNLMKIIESRIDTHKIKNVLDYGGDRGQFIPDVFSRAEKYVYDISGKKAISGIKKIRKAPKTGGKKFDFIMCCHLLEHVSKPRTLIYRIKQFAHKGTVFYFEVPMDIQYAPLDALFCGNPRHCAFSFMMKIPWLYEFATAMYPHLKIQMHEHLNFFSEESLVRVLKLCGIEALYIGKKRIGTGRMSYMGICFLGKMPED
jgi:hypothetical protein